VKSVILLLEDRATDAELVARTLTRAASDFELIHVDSEESFVAALRDRAPDLVLADYHLPAFDGLAALRVVRASDPYLPFIFVSGSIGEELAVQTLRNGATDYVLKDNLTRLPSAIGRALRERDEQQRRLAAEKALLASEERFRYAMMATHELIWEWDLAAGTIWTNLDRNEPATHQGVRDAGEAMSAIHPDDRKAVAESLERAIAGGEGRWSGEHRVIAADGTYRRVVNHGLIMRDERGNATRLIGAQMDVNAQREAEEERNRLAHRNELLLESVQEGIAGVDKQGRVMFVNAAGARMLGRTKQELLGRSFHETSHHSRAGSAPFPAEECPIVRAADVGEVRAYETILWRRDGTSFPAEVDCAVVIDGGRPSGVVVTFADISARRALERQIEQARRINGLGRVAATMAHEFNNVLMGIQPFAEVLRRKHGDPEIQRIAAQMLSSTQRGKNITHEILRFAAGSEVELAPVDVSALLARSAEELGAVLADIELRLIPPDEPLSILGDENALQQVLVNLAINARDAMPQGGTVTIAARRAVCAESGETEARPDWLELSVTDTGSGMAPAVIDRMFEPMFTTKRKGNGLGLAYAHQIITRHGGTISVDTAVGRGTRFSFSLPLTLAMPGRRHVVDDDLATNVRRALVVEDDESVAAATCAALDFAGVAAEVVYSGAEVERAIERSRPDVVVLDIGLPDENGFSVYKRIAARWPDLPVVFASGHVADTQIGGSLAANTAAITKPYRIDELIAAFRQITR